MLRRPTCPKGPLSAKVALVRENLAASAPAPPRAWSSLHSVTTSRCGTRCGCSRRRALTTP
jgi:hypothetical protein